VPRDRRRRRRRRRDEFDEFREEEIWIDPRGPVPDEAAEPAQDAPAPAAEVPHAGEPLAEEPPDEEPAREERPSHDEPAPDDELAPDESARDEPAPEERPRAAAPVRDVIRPGPDSERLGPRRAALHEKRRRRRRRAYGGAAAALVALALAGIGIVFDVFAGDDGSAGGPRPGATDVARDDATTLLLFGTKEASSRPNAIWMNLLYVDRDEDRGAIVYVPAHSAVEVPGRGLQAVGDSLSSGGVPLLLLSTETLLGIPIDHYVELSNTDARLLFNSTGPLSIDVPDQVRVSAGPNKAKLIFDEGLQRLPGSFLVQLLYTVGLDADDVELGARHAAFWAALFEQFAEEPEELAAAAEAAGGALGESDAAPEDVAAMLRDLAALDPADRTLTTLPVEAVSVGGSELFQSDSEEIAAFMQDTLGVDSAVAQEARVQILNGNGEPGIGREAAERLVGEGFRVVLTGNAPRLDYKRTLVVTYDAGPEGTALADRAKELLGVGKVQVSAQAQGIVDLTIVVGKDFLRTR
jgi:anionic cell wall polymer biosynthesis LytR-Cps2A-Psr (LCP) family protein